VSIIITVISYIALILRRRRIDVAGVTEEHIAYFIQGVEAVGSVII
jgi:hypothetical protein